MPLVSVVGSECALTKFAGGVVGELIRSLGGLGAGMGAGITGSGSSIAMGLAIGGSGVGKFKSVGSAELSLLPELHEISGKETKTSASEFSFR